MRAVLLYGLIGFYFLISIGLTADIHFCGGKLKTISFFGSHSGCCKGKMSKGCCEDVPLAFKKLSDDQRVEIAAVPVPHSHTSPIALLFEAERSVLLIPQSVTLSVNAPPPQAFPPIFIKNCVFII